MCLTYLPPNVREAVHFIAFKHLSNRLLETMLNEEEVPKITAYALMNLREDLKYIEQFSDECLALWRHLNTVPYRIRELDRLC